MLHSLSRSWRLLGLCVLLCLGCHNDAATTHAAAASSDPGDLNRRIEVVLRAGMNPPPNIRIEFGGRTPSDQFPGFDNLPVIFIDGQRRMPTDFIISHDNKTLFQIAKKYDLNPDVIKKTMEKIDIQGRPFRGGRDAKVLIVNYDDFQCPFCAKMHQTLFPGIQRQYGDKIKIVYRDFPLVDVHPWAMHAAIDSNCLAQQSNDAFWGFADNIHAHQPDIMGPQEHPRPPTEQDAEVDKIATEQGEQHRVNMNNLKSCIASADRAPIEAEMQEAKNLEINSTPTMFVNGIRVGGIMAEEDLRKIIDLALQDAGETTPTSSASGASGSVGK